jgi:hypothetical protein
MTELAPQKEYPRRIMTFMRRSSAFTVSQQKGIDDYGEYYLLDPKINALTHKRFLVELRL